MNQPTRRNFLSTSASLALAGLASANATVQKKRSNPICVFTKPFNSLSYDQLARQIADLGFDGIEGPIRRGGHIEPDAVPEELPKLMDALRRHKLGMTVMTSDINDPNDPLTEKILRVAAENGVRYYRMKYFKYNESKAILPQITEWNAQLRDLAAMNKELGITAVYQNHSGRNYFGAPLWDLHKGLDGIDPAQVGVAYDIRHAAVEGGMSWPIAFQMIRPHVQVVYVKDFQWGESKKPAHVPLGTGRVDYSFMKMLAKTNFEGPISLHEEYLDHKDPKLVPTHIEAIRKDMQTLQSWM